MPTSKKVIKDLEKTGFAKLDLPADKIFREEKVLE